MRAMKSLYRTSPDFLVAILFVAALLLFGLIFGDDIDRCAIGLAAVFALAMAGGVPECRSEIKDEIDSIPDLTEK